MTEKVEAWRRIRSEELIDCRVFRVRRDRSINPRNSHEHDFYCIEAPDWINIIPLTPSGEVVMIEQYRHGIVEITLEIPGGMVDPGEKPSQAAARELMEETGYRAGDVELLGTARPNPAIMNNHIHFFFARSVAYESAPVFDSAEHTSVSLVPLAEVPALIMSGKITHALVIAAFNFFFLSQGRLNLSAL